MPDDRTDQGENYWTLFTPGIWKLLHAVLQLRSEMADKIKVGMPLDRNISVRFRHGSGLQRD
jgi:hypothetical protein